MQKDALPDDASLTTKGYSSAESGRILLIACGALAREILDIKTRNHWDHMELTCLPAILHVHPERITQAVEDAVAKHRDKFDKIYVVYADCGTGGLLQQACEKLGVEMVKGPHCYSFFEGNQAFEARGEDETTAFYLTDFLARQFDAFVWKPLGLDRHPELRDMYFGNYTKLIYQAQIDNPDLTARARECADRMGLEFERRFTGYGDLETTLTDWANRPT
ncbi:MULTISPECIES: DUF1638 domain-containing protein [unclassified Ruegeria]|uniref:DUF1638 domain-containing protein n=1 Tax=unclassified Ruegeria TaxID=2625375 RepID=UPI001492ED74|nr:MULTISPECIES: DUF1638 domain-containing protein [unclassified Ruegeria]NOD87521.1 DUF1638 domain-containing protein [Ruegeria sp. HKCCD4318]NOE13076.1 DUF1638 domain-containing protein [Ruegeria sp. HKCCD4318-2]NOG08756.1 DUF1638 domain-containing protein [Ruegeria sp. HKCCD4315]